MRREFSAGGVLFKGDQVLLIKTPSGHWSFPKGRIEKGEKPEETAVREVLEETGVLGRIISYLGETKYWFTFDGDKVFKVVKFYLMVYVEGEPKPSWEVQDARFFPSNEVIKLLKYKGDKRIFSLALEKRYNSSPNLSELF